jgi:hypothetical protein
MQAEAVFVGVNGDGSDAKLVGRTENPDGNLTAIGHQQLANRFHRFLPDLKMLNISSAQADARHSGYVFAINYHTNQ